MYRKTDLKHAAALTKEELGLKSRRKSRSRSRSRGRSHDREGPNTWEYGFHVQTRNREYILIAETDEIRDELVFAIQNIINLNG